jgi:hypothetical protein
MQSQDGSKLNRNTKVFAALIVGVAVVLAISSAWHDSIIVDEVPHIGAGYSYLVKQDMRLNPEHPPLAKDVAAIPLLFLNLKQDVFSTKAWLTDVNGQWEFGRSLIFGTGNNADLIKHVAKLPMILFFILSAVLVFKWGRKLYGNTGAIIALVLFAFSPTVMAHSRFVTTDIPALFGVLLSSYFYLKWLESPTKKNLLIAGLTFGIALLCKFSTFLLVPLFGVLALAYGFSHNEKGLRLKAAVKTFLLSIVIMIVGFVVIVWPVYYFHTHNYPIERQQNDTKQLLSSYGNRLFADPVVWASGKPVIRAAAEYGLGLLLVNQRVLGGNTTYFLGDVSRFGWRKYFPIVYFIKEPLAWWGLVLVALLYLSWQVRRRSDGSPEAKPSFLKRHFHEFAMLVWLAIYWGISVKGTLNIGVRHLLPTYPFVILLVSGQLSRIIERVSIESRRALAWLMFVLAGLIGWYVYESVHVYPYYLTYFNQVVGGPSGGYKYVVDSNVDWGQDLIRFSDWVKANNIPKVEFDYFGWADPYYYLKDRYIWTSATKYKDGQDFKLHNQSDGWLAVSVTFLEGSQGPDDMPNKINYLWLQSYTPVTVIGNSIFVYRIK